MAKRAYINKKTGDIAYFEDGKAPRAKEWAYLPPMDRFIDDEGNFHLRAHFSDCTIDIIEQDMTPEEFEKLKRESEAQEAEVIEHGDN